MVAYVSLVSGSIATVHGGASAKWIKRGIGNESTQMGGDAEIFLVVSDSEGKEIGQFRAKEVAGYSVDLPATHPTD